MVKKKSPKLPKLLNSKIYKTSQTRGSQTSEVYQNRVSRNSTVLIPFEWWHVCKEPEPGISYEQGFIVLVDPDWFLDEAEAIEILKEQEIYLGKNALLNFQRREQWDRFDFKDEPVLPDGSPLKETNTRLAPIGGNVIARVSGTTGENKTQIYLSFNETKSRGAGIRVYEYASKANIALTRTQLEAFYWLSEGAIDAAISEGMSKEEAEVRKANTLEEARTKGLLDFRKLEDARIVDEDGVTVCPFCLERIHARTFYKRSVQAEGRETWNLTTTEVSLFHIEELRVGKLQHKPYNLGWGHHHCNVVVKDAGINETLSWVEEVLERNFDSGWKNHASNRVPTEISRAPVEIELAFDPSDLDGGDSSTN